MAVCLALAFPGCSRPPAPTKTPLTKTADPSDLGLSVTERATLQSSANASIESVAFSRDGKELAIAQVAFTRRANRQSFFDYPWDHTGILETFRVGKFTLTDRVTSRNRPECFCVAPVAQSPTESTGNEESFIVVRWLLYTPREITIASGRTGRVIRSVNYEPTFPFSLYPMFPINSVAVAPNGSMVAVAVGAGDSGHALRGEVVVWNLATGEEQLRVYSTHTAFFGVAFSPDGRLVAATGGTYVAVTGGKGAYRGELRCWELATGKLLFETEAPISLGCIAFSPDGRTIAAGHCGAVRFYRTSDGRQFDLHRFVPSDRAGWCGVEALAFSPDGRLLAAGVGSYGARGGNWGELLMLDLASKQAASVGFRGHPHPVTCLAFSPNGRWLAGGSSDGVPKVFFVKPLVPAGEVGEQRPAGPEE